jgi:putative NIF3 family GTP cyclohydrolase 1 type 2
VIVTGEIRHHDALAILRNGKTAIALGHWESERPVLEPLGQRLKKQLPALRVKVSRADTGPLMSS